MFGRLIRTICCPAARHMSGSAGHLLPREKVGAPWPFLLAGRNARANRYLTSQGFASGKLMRPVVQSRYFRSVGVAFLDVLLPEVVRVPTYLGELPQAVTGDYPDVERPPESVTIPVPFALLDAAELAGTLADLAGSLAASGS